MDISSLLANYQPTATAEASSAAMSSAQTMNMNDFLNLLCTEITNQDPTNPMDNKDMILQMAQFSTLEASNDLNKNMTTFISNNNFSSAVNMIGKEITYYDSESGSLYTGVASGAMPSDDGPVLVVGNNTVALENVLGVASKTDTATDSSADAAASN